MPTGLNTATRATSEPKTVPVISRALCTLGFSDTRQTWSPVINWGTTHHIAALSSQTMYTTLFPPFPPVPETNVHNVLFNRPDQQEWPVDYPLLIDGDSGKVTTLQQFKQVVRDGATALGTALSLQGGEQEIVGIFSENSVEYVSLVHSLLYATVPFSLMSSFATTRELVYGLKLTSVARLFVSPKLLSRALAAAKEVGISRDKIYVFGGKKRGFTSLDDLVHQASNAQRLALRPATKDTLAYLVLSSGTSGLPKAVKITHGNLIASMIQALTASAAALQVLPPRSSKMPVGLGVLPIYHSYGLHSYCFRLFMSPATLVMLNGWNLEQALKAIKRYKVSTLNLIPSIIHQLVNNPSIKPEDLESIEAMASGAAYLPPELKEKMSQLLPVKPQLTIGYGMSESTLAVLMAPLPGLLGRVPTEIPPNALGILLPGVDARIVGSSGEDCGLGEVGELWVHGPTITPGYWGNEKATKESFMDGWFKTGDCFSVDKDGFFYFADRAKDTLKVSGLQVSPLEIENTLLSHPDNLIIDATVAGVSGGRTSDEKVPRAWVVLGPAGKKLGEKKVIEALDAWVKQNLSKYKWPRGGIEVIKELPRTATGKVLRRELQAKYEKNIKVKTKL